MIEDLVSSPMLERALSFTEQRHQVILANIANASTPGYVQQDVPVAKFQKAMQDALDRQRQSSDGAFEPESNDVLQFVPGSSTVQITPQPSTMAMAFHDRGVRSTESLMGDLADNAMAHNLVAQLLKIAYDGTSKAISMKS